MERFQKVWWRPDKLTSEQWQRRGGNPLELAACNWAEEMREIEAGLKLIPQQRILELRYESFLRRPKETLINLEKFIEIEKPADWLSHALSIKLYDGNRSSSAATNVHET